MKLLTQNLFDYLEEICRPVLIAQHGTRELRIFLSAFPPALIYELGRQITDYLAKSRKTPHVIFKIGSRVWENWQISFNHQGSILDEIENAGWVDTENKLTYYRNMKWDPSAGKDCLIVILIGVEQAVDKGSLEDFFFINANAIWKDRMKQSFLPWLTEFLSQRKIEQDEQHLRKMDELLQTLYRYGAGDLLKISEYLDILDFTGVFDSHNALCILYGGLSFWGLPFLNLNRMKKKWIKYIESAIEFFSYKPYLKESTRNTALEKIAKFQKHLNEGAYDLELRGVFPDADEFISCLKAYISQNNIPARNQLLKFDFTVIKEDILDFKEKKEPELIEIETEEEKEKKTRERTVAGHPLEAVLTAIWIMITDFKNECTKKHISPADALVEIQLKGVKFIQDIGTKQEGTELIRGCIGGIDDFLREYLLSLEMDKHGETVPVSIKSELFEQENLEIKSTTTGKAQFKFEIILKTEIGPDVKGKFKWVLPETHDYRVFWNLAKQVADKLDENQDTNPGPCLPVFYVRYYNEIFTAPDQEEVSRIINIGLRDLKIVNLLNTPGLNRQDPLWLDIEELSNNFNRFLKCFVMKGYFSCLKNNWRDLFKKTEGVLKKLVQTERVGDENEFAPLLYKSFLITGEPAPDHANTFLWEPYLKSAVITALHPALMEMLYHREVFLMQAWTDKVSEALNDKTGAKLTLKNWEDICDLVEINYPLFGILSNQDKKLETYIESFGLIHRIGYPALTGKTLAAKVLQRYEAPEDDGFSDTKLFRLNREAQLVAYLLEEYTRIYPHANDGLSIAILNAKDVQSVIAGIDEFLKKKLVKQRAEDAQAYPPYHIYLLFITEVTQGQEIARWLNEWQKKWDPAHGAKQYDYYQNCRISVSQKVIRTRDDYIQILANDEFEADIAVLTRFINAETLGNDLVEATAYDEPDWDTPLKFPILEMPRCSDDRRAHKNYRARVISNRRFRLATLHSELSARFKYFNTSPEQQHVVISQGDFTPWSGIVDELHSKSSWVLCLDPSVDERLIGQPEDEINWKREIIGFSSGVGSHGELNYTVSTEGASISDVKKIVRKKLKEIFGPWKDDEAENAAHILVREARKLSGLPLVRATGKGEKVRDLIAFALIQYCLPKTEIINNETLLCDELISLDTFRHWFRNMDDDSQMYPDLMRIVAVMPQNGDIKVFAHLFECKIASDVTRYLEKARSQLENGLRHLTARFRPRQKEKDNRYDQRFWWSQLQRVIANKAVVSSKLQPAATSGLERLGNGYFDISWQATAFTIWSEKKYEHFSFGPEWQFHDRDIDIAIPVIACGSGLIRKIGTQNAPIPLPLKSLFPTIDDSLHPNNGDSLSLLITGEKTLSGTDISITDALTGKNKDVLHGKLIDPVTKSDSENYPRVFLGLTDPGREIFWEFGHSELTNRHILIFGKSGVGKTYAIQALLYELALADQNSVIIDYTDGFLPNHLEDTFQETAKPETHLVRQKPLPINPFRRQKKIIKGFDPILEDYHTVGGRITSVINSVYSSIGEQQRSILTETIAKGLDTLGEEFNFNMLLDLLKDQGSSGIALANKISPLVHMKLFSGKVQNNWQILYNDKDRLVNIMQLAQVPRDIARAATEFILWDLYDYANNSGHKDVPLPLILDEIQNLDHRLESPLGKFLTEGRKFGLSLVLATQTLSNLKTDERDRLFQASHKLFFKPAETEVKEYAKILEQAGIKKADIWISHLNNLNKGECFSLGPSLTPIEGSLENRVFKIRITSFEDRLKRKNCNAK